MSLELEFTVLLGQQQKEITSATPTFPQQQKAKHSFNYHKPSNN